MLPAINALLRSGSDLTSHTRAGFLRGRPLLITETADLLRRHLAENFMCARPDAITQAASPQFDVMPVSDVLVYGFARLTPPECRLIDRLAGPGSRIILPGIEANPLFGDNLSAASLLASKGWQVIHTDAEPATPGEYAADAFLGLPANLRNVSAESFPTPEDEVRTVLRRIKHGILQGEFTIADVALVARSEGTYGEIVREAAWEYQLPVVTHYGLSLLETRAGQWLNSLLELAGDGCFPFEATARLFNHALGEKLKYAGESDTPTLDYEKWERARKAHSRGAEHWDQLGLNVRPIAWPSEGTRLEWCTRIRSAMQQLDLRTQCIERPQDLTAFRKLLDSLDEFALPHQELLTKSEFITQMQDLLRITSVPSTAGSAGLEVHTPLSLYGARVPHLFVLGACEGELPRPVAEDPMLDFHDRKLLTESGLIHLESAAQAARREALSFYSLLLAAGTSLHFTYARMQGTAAAHPSPFLAKMGLKATHQDGYPEIAASEAEQLTALLNTPESQSSNPLLPGARLALEVTRYRENNVPNEWTGEVGIPQDPEALRFSPSQITVFGQCSYHWFADRLLKMRDPEEADDDLAADVKGTLFHTVLASLAEQCKDLPDPRSAMIEKLEAAFEAASQQQEALLKLPGWSGRKIELLNQLRNAILGDAFLPEGSRILLVEQNVRGTIHGLRVQGVVDRIDQTPNGLRIIDYNTSSSKPHGVKAESGKLDIDVQRPIYMHLGAEAARGHGEVTSGNYYSLTKAENLIKKTDVKPGIDDLLPVTNMIKLSVRTGSFPVNPDREDKACAYCELDILCRKGPHLQRVDEASE